VASSRAMGGKRPVAPLEAYELPAPPPLTTHAPLAHFSIDFHSVLGHGSFGVAHRAVDRLTGEALAVKVCAARVQERVDALRHEARLLELVRGNPHVIAMRGHGMIDEGRYGIFFEMAGGGELLDVLSKATGLLGEHLVRRLTSQLIDGLAHCHTRGVCHRDLKLENILLTSSGQLKIIDFGLAHLAGRPDAARPLLRGACGSRSYAAPEVLSFGGYDGFAADLWSCGVCVFTLLFGFFPLCEATPADWRFRALREAQLDGRSSVGCVLRWYDKRSHVSARAAQLVDAMLAIDPRRRPEAKEAAAHTWLCGEAEERRPCWEETVRCAEGGAPRRVASV